MEMRSDPNSLKECLTERLNELGIDRDKVEETPALMEHEDEEDEDECIVWDNDNTDRTNSSAKQRRGFLILHWHMLNKVHDIIYWFVSIKYIYSL